MSIEKLKSIWVVFSLYKIDYHGDHRTNLAAFLTESEAAAYAKQKQSGEGTRGRYGTTSWEWEELEIVHGDVSLNGDGPAPAA
jgi:hypothetical protein